MSAKSELNLLCQQRKLPTPQYTIVSRDGPPHNPSFIISCTVANFATVTSKPQPTRKKAENKAAELAYQLIGLDTDILRENKILELESQDTSSSDDDYVTVLIDGDNVHEALDWIQYNRPKWNIHLCVTQNTVVPKGVKVIRSISDKRDATDVAIIIYVTRYLSLMNKNETLVIVSRDKIFETLEAELSDPRIYVAQTINDLLKFQNLREI